MTLTLREISKKDFKTIQSNPNHPHYMNVIHDYTRGRGDKYFVKIFVNTKIKSK